MSAEGVSNLPGLRKSIRKTAGAITRRSINAGVINSASPTFPTKRKRATLSSQGEPTPKRMAAERHILAGLASLQASITELKNKVDSIPNRGDFEKMEAGVKSMREVIASNTDHLDAIVERQEADKKTL